MDRRKFLKLGAIGAAVGAALGGAGLLKAKKAEAKVEEAPPPAPQVEPYHVPEALSEKPFTMEDINEAFWKTAVEPLKGGSSILYRMVPGSCTPYNRCTWQRSVDGGLTWEDWYYGSPLGYQISWVAHNPYQYDNYNTTYVTYASDSTDKYFNGFCTYTA